MGSTSDLEQVLAEMVAATDSDGLKTLADWVARYPEHAIALRDFAMDADVFRTLEPGLPEDRASEAAFAARAHRVAQRMQSTPMVAIVPITSLIEVAKQRGLTAVALADRLGLALTFVARLEQRLFTPASVPALLVAKLAESLQRTTAEIATYLALPPRVPMIAEYRARQAPAISGQVDFLATVASAKDLTDEQKQEWLVG